VNLDSKSPTMYRDPKNAAHLTWLCTKPGLHLFTLHIIGLVRASHIS
jgi:hypothetical protein